MTEEVYCQSDWVTVSAMQTAEKLVVRAASRAFIGLPICKLESAVLVHILKDPS